MLLEQVWGYRHAADTRLVNVHVQRLRAKIEVDPENPTIVVTVRGVGYKAGTADEPPQPAEQPPGRLAQLRRLPAGALTFWRRSLRTRVVTAIVVLSALVVGSVGWLVMRQITDGLVQSRVDASVAEARTETATARERLGSAGGNDFDPDTQLRLLVENLVARGEVKGFDVVVLGPGRRRQHRRRRTHHAGRRRGQRARHRCARSVERGENGLAWTYTRIRYTGPATPAPAHAAQPGVAVGSTVVLPVRRRAPTRSTTCSRWRRSSRRCCCCGRCC